VLAVSLFLPGLAVLLLSGEPGRGGEGNERSDPVKIPTIDGVDLQGNLYVSKKKNAPTVIFLHAIGDKSQTKGWTGLAETLQPNFTVMMFDFRGHGKSKTIQTDVFWKNAHNVKNVKGAPKKDTIELGDMSKTYYPTFCNDIAAVRAFLDRKNDLGVCNTSSLIVIGAETGATLGAIWINSEWQRYRLIPPAMFGFPAQPAANPEGKDIIAGIWLSPSPKLGTWDVSLTKTLDVPVRTHSTSTVFMYGGQDEKGKTLAKALERNLKTKDDKKGTVTAYEVEGNTKLTGANLLGKATGTDKAIAAYLKDVVENRGAEWTEREFRKTNYVWKVGGGTVPAKAPMETSNLNFDSYEKFIGR